jgi:hypothetical protein
LVMPHQSESAPTRQIVPLVGIGTAAGYCRSRMWISQPPLRRMTRPNQSAVRRVGKGASAPCPPFSIECLHGEWWARRRTRSRPAALPTLRTWPTSHPALIHVNIIYPLPLTVCLAAPEATPSPLGSRAIRRITKHRTKSPSIKSVTVAGMAASLMLAFAGVTLGPAPARAVVYCQYVEYPHGCVARAGVVLRPRPVARAAVRHNAGGNLNGGVNRVGVRR